MSILRTISPLAILSFCPIASAADWPNWRGPGLDGISPEKGWDAEKIDNVIWRAEVGTGFASVAVADGRVYTLGHDGKKAGGKETVFCLDAKDGSVVWKDAYPARLLPNLHEGGPAATPCVHEGNLYTLGKDGRLNCYDARGGDKRWQRNVLEDSAMAAPAEWGFAGSPLIVGNKLIVEAAQTIAYDLSNGEIKWRGERFTPAYATPVPFTFRGRDLLVTLKTEGLVVLDAATGATVTKQDWKTRFSTNATTPIVSGDKIFISTGYKRGCALFQFDGTELEEVYANRAMSNHMANCVLLDGHLYGVTGNTHGAEKKELVCMDFATGEVKWAQGGFGCGTVAAAGGRLIVLSERGELAVAEAAPGGFKELARAQVTTGRCWTVPVLANGTIFTRNAAGHLVAVGVGEASP